MSCKNDDDNFDGVIDPELRPYIEDFIKEAKLRGVILNINDMGAQLVEKFTLGKDQSFCGYGIWDYPRVNKGRFEIKTSENCWLNRTDIEKENLVFHELGHAFLKRPHLNTTFPNRSAKSIMCSSGDVFGCSTFGIYHDYEPFRKYYLDELFDEDVSSPDFTSRSNFIRTIFEEGSEQEYLTDWELFTYIDGTLVEDNAGEYFSFYKESPSSITLTQNKAIPDGLAVLVRRFELTDFTPCANLKAISNVTAQGIENGTFQEGLSLRERLSDGTNRFFIHRIEETDNGSYENYIHELYCISDKTDVVTVSFGLRSKESCSIKIDNLRVDLFN